MESRHAHNERHFPESFIEAETLKDPSAAAAEYLAQFRTDVEQFLTIEAVRACVTSGCIERGPSRLSRYYAFVDPSGGIVDAFSLCIAHREGGTVLIDAAVERHTGSPESIVAEFAEYCSRYRISTVTGDRYGGEWPREHFRNYGLH